MCGYWKFDKYYQYDKEQEKIDVAKLLFDSSIKR